MTSNILNKSEIVVYFSVFIFYIVYQLWMLIEARHKIWKMSEYEFPKGWPILNSFKDDTDNQLYTFNAYLKIYWPWYIFHITVTTAIRKYKATWQSLANAIVCILILIMTMKLISMALLGCLLMSYYFVALRNSKILTWLLSIAWMIAMIFLKSNRFLIEYLGYIEFSYVLATLCWLILRGCSYSLERQKSYSIQEEKFSSKYTLQHFLGYALYFPCLIMGPFMCYNRYIVIVHANNQIGIHKLRQFLWQIFRVLIWWIVLEIATHFVYVHYMAVDIHALEVLDTKFGLYAVVYFTGQFFFMFYVISYGLGIAFAQLEGLNPARQPRCISLVHYYSEVWKYFDEGFYEFLFSHIYVEMCSKNSSPLRKTLATATTFSFVFLWRGHYRFMLIWTLFNFSCLLGEKIVRTLIKSPKYISFMQNNLKLTDKGLRRFGALLGSQILIPALFASCYSISGLEVGNYLMKSVYQGGWWNYFTLSLITYCYFQCCEILQKKYVKT